MTQEMSQLLIDQATQLYRAGAGRIVYGIHDWVAMTNYDSACRVDMTNWILRNRAQSVLHVATTSRMVAMGVMVAKVALGDVLNVHGTTEALEGVLADVLKKPR